MLSSAIDWSQQPQQMNGTTPNQQPIPDSSFQIRSTAGVDHGRKPGSATAADQQAAAAAAPLKCPRCDSSNTKFCYYNNYSLSQPRHFCKACKRYWTRGGTLRNVPVGGGCRKSKQRVRQTSIKPPSGQRGSNNCHDNGPDQTAGSQGQMEGHNLGLNGLLYGKNSANMEELCNGFGASSRVTKLDLGARSNSSSAYNQVTNLGLGFSMGDYLRNDHYDNSSYLSTYSALFSPTLSSPAGVSSAPHNLMRSVLGSGFEQEKFINESSNKGQIGNFLSTLPLEDMHIGGNGHGFGREMKVEELGQMKFNQIGSLSSTSMDPSLQNWINGASTWTDVPNMGSSVMSLL